MKFSIGTKVKSFFTSIVLATFVASPVLADDTEIFFGEGKTANMILVLDASGSMAAYAKGSYGFLVNKDGIHTDRDFNVLSTNDEIIVLDNSGKTEWTVTKNNFKFSDAVSLLPDTATNTKARYPTLQIDWGQDEAGNDYWMDWTPSNEAWIEDWIGVTPSFGQLPKDFTFRWYYKDNRITQLKEAIYQFLGDKSTTKEGDNIGMLSFTTGRDPWIRVIEHIRPLSKVTGGETHRESLLRKLFDVWPNGATPTADAYYGATEYLAGAYTQIGSAEPGPQLEGKCGFNNALVLLTDGIPNRLSDQTHGGFEKVLNNYANPKCDSSVSGTLDESNNGQECTIKLSDHYFTTPIKSNFPGSTINTSTVAFALSDTSDNAKRAKQFLSDTASTLDGKKLFFEPTDSKQLAEVFKEILTATRDSTSFVAPSVPLSQSNRLKHSNDLYMAMFKPVAKETWSGNLKRYSLKEGRIVDELGDPAVDEATGTFLNTASSYWSTVTDGNKIESGGAMPHLSIGAEAKVYSNLTSNNLVDNQLTKDFIDGYIAKTGANVQDKLFGQNTTGAADIPADTLNQYYEWVRNRAVSEDGGIKLNRFGDALHSRPVILEYGNQTVAFISTNQGYLHVVDTDTGNELWSFFPRELLKKVPKWIADEPFADVTGDSNRNYGIDGQMHLHTFEDENGTEKHYLYFAMRRGGNNIYGLDVTSPTSPKMLYTISDNFEQTRSDLKYESERRAEIPNLAQSWTMPAVVKLPTTSSPGYAKKLVFSGGYDTYYDDRNNTIDPFFNTIKGNAIYQLPFEPGNLTNITATKLASETTVKNSIAGNLTYIDKNNDSIVDHIYYSDMGGKIYRMDLTATEVVNEVLADVSADDKSAFRFYAQPDVAFANYRGTDFAVVTTGSGHRSNPKYVDSTEKFYAFFDTEITGVTKSGDYDPIKSTDLFDVTATTTDASGDTVFYNINDIFNAKKKGWFIQLAKGEKVLAGATTINFNTFFTTFIPGPNAQCGASSTFNKLYGVNLLDGASAVDNFDTDGLMNPEDRSTFVNYIGIAPGVTILFPTDTEIATLVGTQTICTGSDCDFFDQGVRTVKWKQKE